MKSAEEKDTIVSDLLSTEKGRVYLAYQMTRPLRERVKGPPEKTFEEVWVEHLADKQREWEAQKAEFRARPLGEKLAAIGLTLFWELIWMPGKSREGSNPQPYRVPMRERLARAFRPWGKRPE